MESILITGASGFIGSFIVQEALKRRFGVWAGIRASSSKKYLKERKIHFLELDFAHPNELRAQLSGHKGTYNKFDYIVHCAGVTKCADKSDFDRVNYLQTKYFVDTLRELNMIPKQFIYISTLSVFGPIREKDYSPISEEDTPAPNTAYGLSKLKAELYIQSIPGFPYVIYRPTGVYGPREADYFLMAKSIRQHTDFSVGYKRQDLTFVYVKDIFIADEVYDYICRLIRATRGSDYIRLGVSPRGTIALTKLSKAFAFLDDRDYVTPKDVKEAFEKIAPHRIVMSGRASGERISSQMAIKKISNGIKAPGIKKKK